MTAVVVNLMIVTAVVNLYVSKSTLSIKEWVSVIEWR